MDEGEKFNGTNIWVGNLIENHDVVFAHNQNKFNNFQLLNKDTMYASGNGDLDDEWEKQKLIKTLTSHAFSVFEHVTRTNDIDMLKDLLFMVAECNKPFCEDTKKISYYRDHE